MKFSVIIPVYNALDDVKLCLDSIIKNYDFKDGEVIVIDDCSREDTANFLKKFGAEHPEFRVDKNEENLGFVKTCNKGMKMVQGDIVILLNSDTIIPKFFQEKILDCFNSDEKIGVASPIASKSWLYKIPLPKFYSIEKMNELLRKKHTPKYPIIPSAEGFCFCIKKQVIDDIGYLDEAYGKGYHEEVDFSYRSIKAGWKNVLIDDLYVYHRDSALWVCYGLTLCRVANFAFAAVNKTNN